MKLREFKTKYLALLLNLKKQLLEKYPERRDRVEYVLDRLANKLRNLRIFTLSDYMAMLYDYTKEFPELQPLIPSEQEINALLSKGGH